MSENQFDHRGHNTVVISFVTRKLIGGYKGEFAKRISQELDVKMNHKVNQAHQDKNADHKNELDNTTNKLDPAKYLGRNDVSRVEKYFYEGNYSDERDSHIRELH